MQLLQVPLSEFLPHFVPLVPSFSVQPPKELDGTSWFYSHATIWTVSRF